MNAQLMGYAERTDEYACAALYDKLCLCSMNKDADGLRAICVPEYVLIHMTGMRQTIDEYIDAVLDGTLNYYSTDHDSIGAAVASDGNSASIIGRSRINAAVFGGGRHTWNLQQDLKAAKRDGTWLLTESRASTY